MKSVDNIIKYNCEDSLYFSSRVQDWRYMFEDTSDIEKILSAHIEGVVKEEFNDCINTKLNNKDMNKVKLNLQKPIADPFNNMVQSIWRAVKKDI